MPCSASYGYFEAWSFWLDGQSIQSACLGRWSILWLARIGKIASAIAGTIILVDILGEQRMQAFGAKVLGRYGSWEYKIATAGTAFPLMLLAAISTKFWSSLASGMAKFEAEGSGGPQILFYMLSPVFGFIALTLGLSAFVLC